jgi:quercetin dioxygenase-like cupin family protein
MSGRNDALDPAVVDAITAAQRPEAEDAAAIARVRSRVMQAIAQDSVRHHTALDAAQGAWHRFLPGIDRKVLHEQAGIMSYLLRFAPGAVLPAHRHPVDEECVVLEGTIRIGSLQLGPGAFHHVPADVLDADSVSDEGCVIYLRGATPKAEHVL